MKRISNSSSLRILLLIVLVASAFTALQDNTDAYSIKRRWSQGDFSENCSIDQAAVTGIAAQMHPSMTNATVVNRINDAAWQWNVASKFKLVHNQNSGDNPWIAQAFDSNSSARTETVSITDMGRINVSLLVKLQPGIPTVRHWYPIDTPAGVTYGCSPTTGTCTFSLLKVALHETGHLLTLGDSPSASGVVDNSVMFGSYALHNAGVNNIFIDDKQGATMIYGFDSSFETNQYLGIGGGSIPQRFNAAISSNVSAYTASSTCGSSTSKAHYWTYPGGTDGIPSSPGGLRFLRFQGCSHTADTSRTAMILASYSDDQAGGDPGCGSYCHLMVQPGMKLRWWQYNATAGQCAAVPGLRFWDDTYLNSLVTSANPANRPCNAGWSYYEIDLTPVAGRRIKEWYLMYNNNGTNSGSGSWRFYIDSLNIG